ncbi:MAG: filamentous hemagglutinin N-terminal domain-containing protein, partial [Gammaproteobacteria bacterium]
MNRKFAGLLLSVALGTSSALAGPQGGQVVAGEGDISNPNRTTTLINQQSNRLVIDWASFNLAPNETVWFNQPSVSAAVLNRILSQNPSEIFGNIIANGQVYLLNPNGIIFGKTAMVNVGGLFATGLNISNSDFMSGNLKFAAPAGQDGGYIINHGVLRAAEGGSINLIGSNIFNDGIIIANLGQVNMVGGSAVTVDFSGDGLMQFQVNGAVTHKMMNARSGAVVTNAGVIEAYGGTVVMTASVAEQVLMQAVNNSGIVQAAAIQNRNGHIYLSGSGGDVVNSGVLDASSTKGNGGSVVMQSTNTSEIQGDGVINVSSATGQGGTVQILGNQVGLFDNASVNANGATGGGTILVGGDAHGAGSVQLANATYIAPDANLSADATQYGDGGQVVVWGTQANNFYGSISARGGAFGGNGGWVETSAHTGLNVLGQVDAAAPNGQAGIWLLDPYNVTIQTGGTAFSNPFTATSTSTIDPANIDSALTGGTNVFVFTNTASNGTDVGNITVDSPITASGAGSLYLEAVGSILLNANIASDGTDPLNVYLWANYGGAAAGTTYSSNAACPTCQVIVGDTANASITTTGGTVDIRTGDASNTGGSVSIGGAGTGSISTGGGGLSIVANGVAFDGAVATGDGNLNVISSGAVSQSQALDVGGTTTISAGTNSISLNNAGNTFTGAISLSNSGANNVLLTNSVATILAGIGIGGNLNVISGGAITQTGALVVTGTSSFSAGANAITLNTAANNFTGAVSLSNSG